MEERIERYCDNEGCKCMRTVEILTRDTTKKFRGEEFPIVQRYAACTVCGEPVYDEKLDTETMQKVSKAYEIKHSINAEFLKDVRKFYGITQPLFAKVLGMSVATIKRYETGGSLPSLTQIGIFKLLKDRPEEITTYYEQNKCNLSFDEQSVFESKLRELLSIEGSREKSIPYRFIELNYGSFNETISNGLVKFNPDKFFDLICFFARNGILKTKLMKLLWYTDFVSFKRQTKSISGMVYIHKQYGPVPMDYELILEYLEKANKIQIVMEENEEGYTKININSIGKINEELFKEEEKGIIYYVEEYFKYYGSRKISDFAHETDAWMKTIEGEIIPYTFADSVQL